MNWRVTYPQGSELRTRWADVQDVVGRIAQFQDHLEVVPAKQQRQIEIYAEATYLKYRSAREDFSATAASFAVWSRRRDRSQESLALLEAWTVEAVPRVAGAILMRSGWNGDMVIDFVVANKAVTKAVEPQLENIGALLIAAVLDVGHSTRSGIVWAETAEHSTGWWSAFLPSAQAFIRFDSVDDSRERLRAFLKENDVAFETH